MFDLSMLLTTAGVEKTEPKKETESHRKAEVDGASSADAAAERAQSISELVCSLNEAVVKPIGAWKAKAPTCWW